MELSLKEQALGKLFSEPSSEMTPAVILQQIDINDHEVLVLVYLGDYVARLFCGMNKSS